MKTEVYTKAFNGVLTLLGIGLLFGILFLIAVVALITWIVKKVWYAGSNRKYKQKQKEWRQYERDYKRQEKERAKYKEQHKSHCSEPIGKVKNGVIYSPTGWRWDDEAKIWIPPEK